MLGRPRHLPISPLKSIYLPIDDGTAVDEFLDGGVRANTVMLVTTVFREFTDPMSASAIPS